jgi:tetratricopeptide (TPR) repeat protein
MRLTSLFIVLAASTPLSLAQAQQPPAAAPVAPAPHDESVPHVHEDDLAPKDETLVDYLFRKSDQAFHDGDYERAIKLHRAIVTIDPTETESYSLGAWLLWSLGRPDEAVQFLTEGVKANPQDVEMWDLAGQHYDLQKRFTDSENAFAKAVEFSGNDADQMLRRRYAHAAEHAGNWTKSAEIWRALVAQFPDDSINRNNLARVEKSIAEQKAAKGQQTAALIGGTGLLATLAFFPKRSANRVG